MTVKAAQSNFFKYRMVLERNGVLLGGGGGGGGSKCDFDLG